jgi:hypothetical protein
VAAQISDRDNAVRSAALNTMVTIYGNVGDDVYKFTSQVGSRVSSCLCFALKGVHPLWRHTLVSVHPFFVGAP